MQPDKKNKIPEIPIVIIGVPRSGTTLLRVLLGEHSLITSLPETPWITGSQNTDSLRGFIDSLCQLKSGPVKSIDNISRDDIIEAARVFFFRTVSGYRDISKKPLLCIKTPDDIKYIDFLVDFFDTARFVHITRDGRDVALSTIRGRSDLLGKELSGYGSNNIKNALRRWADWEEKIAKKFTDSQHLYHHITYESLISKPEEVLTELCEFLNLSYEKSMSVYQNDSHTFPIWEQGSKDVKLHQGQIDSSKVQVWREKLPLVDMKLIDSEFGASLKKNGYDLCSTYVDLSSMPDTKLLKWSFEATEATERLEQIKRNLLRLPWQLARNIKHSVVNAFSSSRF